LSVKRRERSLKYKTKEGWKKVTAPFYDPKCQQSVHVLKFLLSKLFGYKVRESRTTVIPFGAFQDGIRNPKNQLPTVNLVVDPPLTFPYGLQKSSLSCIYWGEGWFLILGKGDENEREILNKLISDMEKIYPEIRECLAKKDYEGAKKIFNQYYGIEEIKPVKRKPKITEAIIEKEETESIKEERLSKSIEIPKTEEIISQPEISERSKEEEIYEIPEYEEKMEREISEFLKNKYDPKNFDSHVLPWMTYEVIKNLGTETERKKATALFFVYLKRDCKRDSLGEFILKELNKCRNQIEARLLNRRF
jgi:hypothetical protein